MVEPGAGATGEKRQSTRFMVLYALAVAGGAIAYVPLLTILLPVMVEAVAGDASVTWLAVIAFAGAVASSLANIAFGWLSDRTGHRRGWIFAGLSGSSLLLIAIGQVVANLPLLVVTLVAWQVFLNMMLGPLAAWGGDLVPDHQKGTLGGLLALAPALGALSGTLVTFPGLADGVGQAGAVSGVARARRAIRREFTWPQPAHCRADVAGAAAGASGRGGAVCLPLPLAAVDLAGLSRQCGGAGVRDCAAGLRPGDLDRRALG